jgi:hypothetical protein
LVDKLIRKQVNDQYRKNLDNEQGALKIVQSQPPS